MTDSRAEWSRPARRRARPTRSSSGRWTRCANAPRPGSGSCTRPAKKREAKLHAQGLKEANLYGHDDKVYGGLNAFFLLMDKPEAYGLPNAENAVLPGRNNTGGYLGMLVTGVLGAFAALFALRERWKGGGNNAAPTDGGHE